MEGMVFTLLMGVTLLFCPLNTVLDANAPATTQHYRHITIEPYGFSFTVPPTPTSALNKLRLYNSNSKDYCEDAVGRSDNLLCTGCRASACRLTEAASSLLLVVGMMAIVFFGFATLAACHLVVRRTPSPAPLSSWPPELPL